MSSYMTLYFLTGNAHKLREARAILPQVQIEGIRLDLDEIQELEPERVIAHKLQQAGALDDRRPLICEDVSLVFKAYHRLPGPLVKWFIEAAPKHNGQLLLQMLEGQSERSAEAICHYGLLDTEGQMHFFSGSVQGSVATELRGDNGFGWDPLFIPAGQSETFAEMPQERKQLFSHRQRALQALQEFLAS